MEAQDYLKEIVNEAKIFMEKSTIYRNNFDELFKEAKENDNFYSLINKFDEEKKLDYFNSSRVIVDSQILFQKIASFIHFCKILGIELEVSEVSNVSGLLEFIKNYKPFDTEFVINPEEELTQKDSKDSELKFNEFKKALNTTNIG